MSEPKVIETLDEFNELIKSDKITIVDFWAAWCGPCVRIAPWFKEQAEKYPNVNFAKVDVDENSETSEKNEINCMPTFKCFVKGECIKTIEGADKEELEKLFTLDQKSIEALKEENAKIEAEKAAMAELEKNVVMVKNQEEYDEFKKNAELTATNFYVPDYKPFVDALHKDICQAVNDESNSNFTSENIRRCNLNEHGQLGNALKVRSLPWVVINKNDQEVMVLKEEEDCTVEKITEILKMSDEEIQAKLKANAEEKARLEKLVKQIDELEEFTKLVEEERKDKLTVVDFYATWCGPCINFAPTFMKMADQYEKDDSKDVKFVKIDCDKNTGAKTKAGIKCFPTFKLYKNGEIVDSLEGASKDKLEEMIQKHL
jgi:thioredoxin 1